MDEAEKIIPSMFHTLTGYKNLDIAIERLNSLS